MPSQTMWFDVLLEAMPDALVGVDRSGVIRFVNLYTESLFGYQGDDLVGVPFETLVPGSVRHVHVAHREGYNAVPRTRPKGTDLKLRGQRRDGTKFPVDIALSPMDTEDGMLVIAVVRDLTHDQSVEANQRQDDRLPGPSGGGAGDRRRRRRAVDGQVGRLLGARASGVVDGAVAKRD